MTDSLTNLISKKVALKTNDIELCKTYFEIFPVEKNTIIEEMDKVPKYLYFIVSGYMRLFYYDDSGDEVTNHISSPNNFIAPFLNLINENKSAENVECITHCELLRITRQNLIALIDKSENFKTFSLIIFEQAIDSGSRRANDFATLNAVQRYKKILEEQPGILQNIPIRYIASYLGIKPQSLSRIRRQII